MGSTDLYRVFYIAYDTGSNWDYRKNYFWSSCFKNIVLIRAVRKMGLYLNMSYQLRQANMNWVMLYLAAVSYKIEKAICRFDCAG